LKQRLLVLEVQVNRSFRHAGAARHIVDARRCKSARGKFIERRRENGLSPCSTLFGSSKPARRRLAACSRIRHWGRRRVCHVMTDQSVIFTPTLGRMQGGACLPPQDTVRRSDRSVVGAYTKQAQVGFGPWMENLGQPLASQA